MGKIANYIKYNKNIYFIYYYFFSFFIRNLGVFFKTDKHIILFNSFGGKKFDDSPRVLFEKITNDSRFMDYKIYWAFNKPKMFEISSGKKIKNNSLNYFRIALKAKYWITNSSIERGLNFKKKTTICINTWHGTPIKIMGSDINDNNLSFKSRNNLNCDYFLVQGNFEEEIFRRVFNLTKKQILRFGLPRNEELLNLNLEKELLRKKIGIKPDKKIILYAPTFREFHKCKNTCTVSIPLDFNKLIKDLNFEYIILLRSHYEVSKSFEFKAEEYIIDVSDYCSLNELMIISDILLSDYSSIIYDYSLLKKPIILYCFDYNEYNHKRGMYFDIRTYFRNANDQKELVEIIKNCDKQDKVNSINFQNQFLNYYGNSCNLLLDFIYKLK